MYQKGHSSRGGGVLLAISNDLDTEVLPSPDITVRLNIKHPVKICLIYIPP